MTQLQRPTQQSSRQATPTALAPVVTHSNEVDTHDAIADLFAQCERQAEPGVSPCAALLYASIEYDHQEILDAIEVRWPGLPLIGSTTDGELSKPMGMQHDSMLLVLLFGDIEARVVCLEDLASDHADAATRVTEQLEDFVPTLCFTAFGPIDHAAVLSESLSTQLRCPVFGGVSASYGDLADIRTFGTGQCMQGGFACLAIRGALKIGWGLASGWNPVGRVHTVTASEGPVVHSIDGERTTDFLHRQPGTMASLRRSDNPIAIFPDGPDGPHYLRCPFESDLEAGSVSFAGDVPVGALIRMTEVLNKDIVNGSRESARQAVADFDGDAATLVFVITCSARKKILGTGAPRETDAVFEELKAAGVHVPCAGFYSFGEIAPLNRVSPSRVNNGTCITILIGP